MPTQIGAGNDSGVTLYYVPPPDQNANVFTSFWAGFLSERMPLAQQVFAARLAQMEPADYSEAILEYDRLIADRAKQIEETATKAARTNNDVTVALIGYEKGTETARINQSGQSARLERELQEKRRLEATLDVEQQDEIEAFRLVATTPGASEQSIQFGIDSAIKAMGAATPGQRATASRYLASAIDNIADPILQDQMRAEVLQRLGAPGQGPEEPMASAFGGGPSAQSRARVDALARSAGAGAPRGAGGTFATPDQEFLGVSSSAPRASAQDDEILADLVRRRDELVRDDGRTPIVDFRAPIIGGPDASVFLNAYERAWRRNMSTSSLKGPTPEGGTSTPKSEPPAKGARPTEDATRPESMAPTPAAPPAPRPAPGPRVAPPAPAPAPTPAPAVRSDSNMLTEAARDPEASRQAMRDFAQRTARQEAPDLAEYSPSVFPPTVGDVDLEVLQGFTEEMRRKREREAAARAAMRDFANR